MSDIKRSTPSLSSSSDPKQEDAIVTASDVPQRSQSGDEAAGRPLGAPRQKLKANGKYEVHWYRSTFFQATVLGFCSFLAPGLWGGLTLLGAGGSQSPSLVNASNSLT